MVETFTFFLLASLIFLAFQLARLWPMRRAPGAIELILCSLACDLWSFGYALEILTPGLPYKLFWAKFQYLGIATVSVWVLLFILRYTGRVNGFSHWYIAALMVIPALTIIFTATNGMHGLMWTRIALQTGWPSAPLALDHGWWFYVIIGYSYLLLLVGTAILARFTFRAQRLYLSQSVAMLGAMLAPWVGNALYVFGVRPGPHLDLTPIAFTLTNLGLAVGFARFRLLDILPVAFSSIFQWMSDGVIVLDTKDRIVDMNPAARRIFPRPNLSPPTRPRPNPPVVEDPYIGQRMGSLLSGWDGLAHGGASPEENEIRISGGAAKGDLIYTLRAAPTLDRRRRATGQVLIFTDITQLKRNEAQMRLQVTALETTVNGMVITDPQGQIEWVNPAFTRLTGYAREEALGNNPRILKSGAHPDEHYRALWETITAGKVWQGEMINRRKDGSQYYEEMTITPMVQPDGTIAHFIAIKQDITGRKRAEEELRVAHEQALESNRMKTQLLANVSHDMRTPLGAIIGYADMLCAGVYGEMSGEQTTAVADIQDSANQLLLFVNNLIGQAQFDTGSILLKPRSFPAADLVETCRSVVSVPAGKKGLRVECMIAPGLPEMLYGDPYWLRQVVLNLVSNAVKFTDQGSVTMRVYRPDAEHWAVDVADTGIGISVEEQVQIFEPFRQASGSLVRERGGSGLGLAIVKELAALMGGQISLVSRKGAGSTFTVSFPFGEG